MAQTKRDILDTEAMLTRLTNLLAEHGADKIYGPRIDAESLRKISMTLHRWHELECGTDSGCIERGQLSRDRLANSGYVFNSDENGRPYWAYHGGQWTTYSLLNDREAGAKRRLARIMARYPSLTAYIQTDPRGCALYILRPGDVPAGADISSCYSRGLAVFK